MEFGEKVKKGLETCIGKCVGNKPHCPYHTYGDGCMDSMNRDALAYIQQLEAKPAEYEKPLVPMTLEEAYEADHVFIEYVEKGSSEPQVVLLGMMTANSKNEKRVEIMEFGEDVDYCVKLSCEDYGKTWRCWSRRPTDEERKAAKWDD